MHTRAIKDKRKKRRSNNHYKKGNISLQMTDTPFVGEFWRQKSGKKRLGCLIFSLFSERPLDRPTPSIACVLLRTYVVRRKKMMHCLDSKRTKQQIVMLWIGSCCSLLSWSVNGFYITEKRERSGSKDNYCFFLSPLNFCSPQKYDGFVKKGLMPCLFNQLPESHRITNVLEIIRPFVHCTCFCATISSRTFFTIQGNAHKKKGNSLSFETRSSFQTCSNYTLPQTNKLLNA